MALIECPDCGKQISDSATTCIGCGRPLRSVAPSPAPTGTREAPVLIEQSSKKWKSGMLIGIGMVVLAFIVAGTANGPLDAGGGAIVLLLLLGGALVFIVSLVANWWHHG